MHRRRFIQTAAVAAAAALATTSCLGGGGGGGGTSGGGGGDNTVEILFGFGGDQSKGFQNGLNSWAQQNGITIKYSEASQSFNTLVSSRVAGNNLPDIAIYPQPGLMLDHARAGKLKPLDQVLDLNALQSTLVAGELTAGTAPDGKVYGAPMSMNVKSLVWYPKKAFEAAGYKVPTTIAELEALTNQIKADGKTPWCVGIESGAASGWPLTDWVEDFVLRFGGPDKYDQWVKHQIPFTDPVVRQAFEEFQKLTFPDGNTYGGRQGMTSNNFATAGNPMFDNPPKCFLHRQGSFIIQKGFFPDAVRNDLDNVAGVFQLPGVNAADKPVLGGGDLVAVFNNKDAAKKVAAFITSDKFNGDTKTASYMSPHKTFDMSLYPDNTTRTMANLAYKATVFRFDGSDQMPGAVGTGSFWKGAVAWVSGQKDLNTVLGEIDASWPKQ